VPLLDLRHPRDASIGKRQRPVPTSR
jgi:hypothetical protein